MFRLVCLAALAHGSIASHVAHYESPYSNGWVKSPLPVSGSGTLHFTIVIREQNIDTLKNIALEVNTPSSPKYGHFLTQAELDKLTAPTPSDVAVVTDWLSSEGVDYVFRTPSNVEVSTSVAKASLMLSTLFHEITNHKHGQSVVRAADYFLPSLVHDATAAIFGLHGLPLPPTKALRISSTQGAAIVTADVLASTYNFTGVKGTGSLKNRQAVAAFQGQKMNTQDLATLFKTYVKDYKVGSDDTVYRYVGAPREEGEGLEAELDIQYIMSPAVGVKTEFWNFPGGGFCNDLNKWSANLTSMADTPIVHSVSYGWQSNLTEIHCMDKDQTVVDNNFAKLAAKGISILVSSGDAGSGYSSTQLKCDGSTGVGLVGKKERTIEVHGKQQCCEEAQLAVGWSFVEESGVSVKEDGFEYSFSNALFHTHVVGTTDPAPFKEGSLEHLTGDLNATGGTITAKSDNGTWPDTEITFSGMKKNGDSISFNISGIFSGQNFNGKAAFFAYSGGSPLCLNLLFATSHAGTIVFYYFFPGANPAPPPPPPPPGVCTIYSNVTTTTKANSSTTSGILADEVLLWPAWPASSPWVTAVGATRFVGQKVGAEEMAADKFGSGGGFSKQFSQEPYAKWQESAVASYLSTVDPSTLPPAGSFPPKGRATPDVSALGEGYQVFVRGAAESVGGTSASCPAFAAMVSLLNENRLNAGKKQMGFLNPFLYANPDAFTDVVKGSNKIGRSGEHVDYGYNCT
eukprot:Hpha_TRINITY_DN9783_c0_g1::TRINITY_DN9783_c0_g1_i2::g.10297::m.10297/K01279/TPP1, CLN2; tripeptidyl-peptidase I